MKKRSFTTTMLVAQTPREVFKAINNVREWWSENIEGSTHERNDEFIHRYKDVHYCKIRIIEVVPDQKVVWLVMNNYFSFTEDKSEWVGTKINFEISRKGNQTQIDFTHQGLVPQYECYEICRDSWNEAIGNSLRSLIETGEGQPDPKEEGGFDAELFEQWMIQ